MSDQDPTPRPLGDTINDPRGIISSIPEEFADSGFAGEYFVHRVQQIRWELWGLIVDLDAIEAAMESTSLLMPQVIDLLGVIARAEAAYVDSKGQTPPDLSAIFTQTTEFDEMTDSAAHEGIAMLAERHEQMMGEAAEDQRPSDG